MNSATKHYILICMSLGDSQDFLCNPHSLAAAKTCWEKRSGLWRSSCKCACRWAQTAAPPLENRLLSLFMPASNSGCLLVLICVLEASQRWSEETGAADGEAESAVRGEGPCGSAEGHTGQGRGCRQGGNITGKRDFLRAEICSCIWTSLVFLGNWSRVMHVYNCMHTISSCKRHMRIMLTHRCVFVPIRKLWSQQRQKQGGGRTFTRN